jgi:23S rRNA (uracil1939-C5)-methyltransferase
MSAFEVTVERLVHGGEGLAHHHGQVVLVPYSVPGDRLVVETVLQKRDFVRARIVQVLEPSQLRTGPQCIYFGQCGGCQLQHIGYEGQLNLKAAVVAEQLERIGGLSPEVSPTLASPLPFKYRNHARFSVDRTGRVGFTRYRSHSIVPIDVCLLMADAINSVVRQVQGRLRGIFQLSVRYGHYTGQLLVNPPLSLLDIYGIRSGQPYYEEKLLGRTYRVSAASFFQVNTPAAEMLVKTVLDFLELEGHETVVDAYSGVGTFAVILAEKARAVIGIEESPSAVEDALFNVAGLDNVRIVRGKVEEVLPSLREKVDAVVLDPARVGCEPAVIEALRSRRPGKVVYVSCDPATLARDLKLITAEGMYRVRRVQPVDMFPQTYHIESVALLELA